MLGLQEQIKYAVDINPRKHGKFIPGTAQEIVPPEFLKTYQPHTVVIFNPIYTEEIQADLSGMGIECEVVTV